MVMMGAKCWEPLVLSCCKKSPHPDYEESEMRLRVHFLFSFHMEDIHFLFKETNKGDIHYSLTLKDISVLDSKTRMKEG